MFSAHTDKFGPYLAPHYAEVTPVLHAGLLA